MTQVGAALASVGEETERRARPFLRAPTAACLGWGGRSPGRVAGRGLPEWAGSCCFLVLRRSFFLGGGGGGVVLFLFGG